jgi:hypothetical protein
MTGLMVWGLLHEDGFLAPVSYLVSDLQRFLLRDHVNPKDFPEHRKYNRLILLKAGDGPS